MSPFTLQVDTSRIPGYHRDMNIDWSLLFIAVGLALVFEGIPYFLFAERMPLMLVKLAEQTPKFLRFIGLTAIILGLLTIAFGRSLTF